MPERDRSASEAADSYFTPDEVAERLKVSVGTVRNMLAAGELRALRFRRRVRIPRAEIDRFERDALG